MSKSIVMDANILIRGILGKRVPQLLEEYGGQNRFFTVEVCYDELRQHLPTILRRREISSESFLDAIDALESVMIPLGLEVYGAFEDEAKRRIGLRDERDWPLLALALALDCPI